MSDSALPHPRRTFLKLAGAAAVTTAAGCTLESRSPVLPGITTADRETGFERPLLEAVAAAVLPSTLGTTGIDAAVTAFIAFVDGYEPVAEEMHGYGYSDIRYLPADPAPAWRAQLTGLNLLARKSRAKSFAELTIAERQEMLARAVQGVPGDRLPNPIEAPHVALALLAHWASGPEAWDLALGAKVQPGNCRVLADANAKPAPITVTRA